MIYTDPNWHGPYIGLNRVLIFDRCRLSIMISNNHGVITLYLSNIRIQLWGWLFMGFYYRGILQANTNRCNFSSTSPISALYALG